MSMPPYGSAPPPPPGHGGPPHGYGAPPQGYAGAPPAPYANAHPGAPPPKKGMSGCLLAAIIVGVLGVFGLSVMVVLGIYGTRRYISKAKQAEARTILPQIASLAKSRYERGETSGVHRLCPSSSQAVPSSISAVRAKKYVSLHSDWTRDRARDAGFSCLSFELSMPQYYQYEYEATATSFVVRARGDLDGDGTSSVFELRGRVVGTSVEIDPLPTETDPDE